MVAETSFAKCIDLLKPNGRYLMANPRLTDMLKSVMVPLFSNKHVLFSFAGETEEELHTLKLMIEEGKIGPVVDKVFSMEEAVKPHYRVETEQRLGSVVISCFQENRP
jgi:NADPH:quinone reductase-like Zn-dependent oxidoreductase